MAAAAGFSFGHISHSGFADDSFVRECFSVTIFAAVNRSMKGVTECCRCYPFEVERYLFRLEVRVAAVTASSYRKCPFAVVTSTTGAPFFHFRHSYRFSPAGYNFAVMARFAGATCFGNMSCMAEDNRTETFNCVWYVLRLAGVTAGTVLVAGDTEGFYSAMACSAGFGFLHFCHGVALFVFKIEENIVAHSAIIIVLLQVGFVAEYD